MNGWEGSPVTLEHYCKKIWDFNVKIKKAIRANNSNRTSSPVGPSPQHLHRSTARTGRRSTSFPSSGVRQPTWKVFLALYPERRGLWTRRQAGAGVAAPHIPSANIRTCRRRSTTTTWWSWRRRAGEQSVNRVNQGPAAAPSPLPRHRGRYSPEHRGLRAQMSCNLQLQRCRRGPCQRPE